MSSEKLRKYLAYYQRVLKSEPENIEARLRLAAIFREMGKESHAVEEYVAASKLLAKEGLPLEAIAACKAVLELEPHHTEIQYFLARLFAQVPEAMGHSARVAQPVDPLAVRQSPHRAETMTPRPTAEPEQSAFLLREPKGDATTRQAPVDDAVWLDEPPTQTIPYSDGEGLAGEVTSPLDEDFEKYELPSDERTRPLEIAPAIEARSADAMRTREYSAYPTKPPPRPGAAPTKSVRPPLPVPGQSKTHKVETFEVNVFDMESLELDEDSEVDFTFLLEELDGEVGDFVPAELSESVPAVFQVSRQNLPQIELFSKLPADVFMRLLAVIDLQKVSAGTTILEPDHMSRTLFVVVRGTALVTRLIDGKEVELATMAEGEFFGEFVLLTGRTGLATVRAKTDCEVLAIHERVVNDIADEYPEIWDILWDFYYARMLNNLLASSAIFRPLDVGARSRLARRFEMQEVVANEVFLREGDACRYLYLILSGEVEVERRIAGSVQSLVTLREGEFFGLASSLNDEPYLADLRATRDTVILRLPSEDFRALTNANPAIDSAVQLAIMSRRELNSAFLSGITAYAELGVAKLDG